ncbi:MAG TPA: sodium/substrate symporter small subunit [Ramlibacter sp.]|nr:sodium/substrate symporter small subunit [Ramlibacter sp.]
MGDPEAQEQHDPRVLALKAALITVWASVSFGVCYFARELDFLVGAWPFSFWMAAQGCVLVFIAIVVLYATLMRRLAPDDSAPQPAERTDA